VYMYLARKCLTVVLKSRHIYYFFSNRISEIWNALPSTAVAASSLNVFKRLLECVDLPIHCL